MRNVVSHRLARLLGAAAIMATAVTGAVTTSATPAFATGFGQVGSIPAFDIGVGANGSVWITGAPVVSDGSGLSIYRWNESRDDFDLIPGAAGHAIDVDQNGNAWVVDDLHRVFHYDGSKFVPEKAPPGGATDIGVGANGNVWAIGTDNQPGGHTVYKRTASGDWTAINGSALQIDVLPNGNPWVVQNNHDIYRWNGNGWTHIPGAAIDVGIGSQGDIWVLAFSANEGVHGYSVCRYNGNGWTQVAGAAIAISSGNNLNPWVVNRDFNVYKWAS